MDVIVFQGLSAAIFWGQIAEIRKIDFYKSVHDWMSQRSVEHAESLERRCDRAESSRARKSKSASPKKGKQRRCACCPEFEFGCLQKLQIVDEDDEDDYTWRELYCKPKEDPRKPWHGRIN